MKEKPILFSAPIVRAILDGTKPGRSWGDNPYVWCIEFRRLP